MKLIDTNIFLEILLNQEKENKCKAFLENTTGEIYISDFSLHSIGVLLFKSGKPRIFSEFLNDTLVNIPLISLSIDLYDLTLQAKERFNLDFDDAYQFAIAKENGLSIVTLDKDFKRVKGIEVKYL